MDLLPLVPLLPLFGAALCGAIHVQAVRARRHTPGVRVNESIVGLLAVLAVAGSFAVSCQLFLRLAAAPAGARVLAWSAGEWLPTGGPPLTFGLSFDPLSAVLCLVVTGVGALIHLYATGYMKGDPGFARFFAYLNLFVAAMLLLVLGDSLPILFIGWEGVGLCSYLLIGFWYEDRKNAEAGQKAFVVNRIGDFGFLLAMFAAAAWCGTFTFEGVNAKVEARALEPWQTTVLGLLLFVGACGKSAQIPLYVWLPDAMAGPTPVSALIHAATMVTAGVYLVIRMHPVYDASPVASGVVACVGGLTALFAATMGLVARDIKKVLAYSTVSQLGYLFLAAGVGAYGAGFYHLVTHAFFKALLFLGAGAVIVALHHEQDLTKMGGLKRALPATYRTMVVGALALAGFPLLSGYFSKDEILAGVLAGRPVFGLPALNAALYAAAAFTAFLTAFYTFRLVTLAFEGAPRGPAHAEPNPKTLTNPLVVLAAATLGAALLGLPLVHVEPLAHWLEPVLGHGSPALEAPRLSHGAEIALLLVSAAISIAGILLARHFYRDGLAREEAMAARAKALYSCLSNRWYVDELYTVLFVRPLKALGAASALFDGLVVDGLVNAVASVSRGAAARLRDLATGRVQSYSLWFGAGVVGASAFLLWMRS